MTGAQFTLAFERKINKSFSNYYSTTELDELFKESLTLWIENKYENLVDQDSYDAINTLIKTNQVFELNANRIYEILVPISLIVPSASPTAITTAIPHNLTTGDVAYLTGVAGTMSAINAQFFSVTVTGTKTFTVPFNSTGLIYTSGTGQIAQHQSSASIPKMIPDYYALLAAKFKYNQPIPNIRITGATNAQPIVITLSTKNNNVKTGDQITNAGIFGNPNANGTFYVKKLGALKYELYYDKYLSNSASGNGIYTGGGTLTRPLYNYAIPLYSYKKISPYDKPDVYNPAFERAEGFIKATPSDEICTEATLDYISTSTVFIVSTDTATELEDTYSLIYLYEIMDKAVELFFLETKDFQSMQAEQIQEQNK